MRTEEKSISRSIKTTRELKSAQVIFDAWRDSRKKRERIPEHLWEEAVHLCKFYKTSQVVKELRLNYKGLKSRLDKVQIKETKRSNRQNSIKKRSMEFVELKDNPRGLSSMYSVPTDIMIELQKSDGTLLKVSVPQGSGISVPDILSLLTSSRQR